MPSINIDEYVGSIGDFQVLSGSLDSDVNMDGLYREQTDFIVGAGGMYQIALSGDSGDAFLEVTNTLTGSMEIRHVSEQQANPLMVSGAPGDVFQVVVMSAIPGAYTLGVSDNLGNLPVELVPAPFAVDEHVGTLSDFQTISGTLDADTNMDAVFREQVDFTVGAGGLYQIALKADDPGAYLEVTSTLTGIVQVVQVSQLEQTPMMVNGAPGELFQIVVHSPLPGMNYTLGVSDNLGNLPVELVPAPFAVDEHVGTLSDFQTISGTLDADTNMDAVFREQVDFTAAAGGDYAIGLYADQPDVTLTVVSTLTGASVIVNVGSSLPLTIAAAPGEQFQIFVESSSAGGYQLGVSDSLGNLPVDFVQTYSIAVQPNVSYTMSGDELLLSDQADSFKGGSGSDWVNGGAGNDVIKGGKGSDWVHGGAGDDAIQGNAGNDLLNGGLGHDTLSGGSGHDLLIAKGGQGLSNMDTLKGDRGDDILLSVEGQNVLSGGSGHDVLIASNPDGASVTVYGNAGNDTFMLANKMGELLDIDLIIADFGRGADTLDMSALRGAQGESLDFAALMQGATQDADSVTIDLTAFTLADSVAADTPQAAAGSVTVMLDAGNALLAENVMFDGGLNIDGLLDSLDNNYVG
ncbi:MAG: calcium-binding protein [Motiliproteus sp.]